jgi:DNA-binding transcriptional regulator YhcF (GntR family)
MTNRLAPIKLDSYQPLREVVCESLREAIRNGILKPGERIMEIQLAEELGVSRTPVREAIRKLELEGYVVMMPRRGTYVASMSIRDINEIFEDIIGVTYYYEDTTVHKILFWVSDYSKSYVLTKPLHESQRTLNKMICDELHEKYPTLQGGQFFRIDCRKNYELIRELCSFGQHLLVLEPSCIQDEIFERIKTINEEYSKLRTKRS